MSNWNLINKNDLNANSLLQYISELDSSDVNLWKKWKSVNNQLVVKTQDYYYKIYVNKKSNSGIFLADIRNKLATIYREKFQIHWNIKTISSEDLIIQIEQRQPLEVCNEENIKSFDNLFSQWRLTLLELEERLELPRISLQLKDEIPDLYKLKLVRECINSYEDYALTPNGDVVLLDDTDWFLALTDIKGNWFCKEAFSIEVLTQQYTYLFMPLCKDSFNNLGSFNTLCDKWILQVAKKEDNEKESSNIKYLMDMKQRMLTDNIKFLNCGYLEDNKKLIEFKGF